MISRLRSTRLSRRAAQVVTVNDYLARRDSEWVGQVHRFLGLRVGLVQQGLDAEERKAAYQADITYVTNSELGFDYLRDNLAQVRALPGSSGPCLGSPSPLSEAERRLEQEGCRQPDAPSRAQRELQLQAPCQPLSSRQAILHGPQQACGPRQLPRG